MANPLIVIVNRADIVAALSEIDTAPTLGPDVANLIRAYITALETQVKRLYVQAMNKSGRLAFYGECDYAELYRRSMSGALTMGEDIAP